MKVKFQVEIQAAIRKRKIQAAIRKRKNPGSNPGSNSGRQDPGFRREVLLGQALGNDWQALGKCAPFIPVFWVPPMF